MSLARLIVGRVVAGLLLAGVLVGCGGEPPSATAPQSESESQPDPSPTQSLPAPPPLGTDAFAVRDALVESIESAGGVRLSVSGPPGATSLDLAYDPRRDRFARSFTWQENGETREVMELATRKVCLNLAAARALTAAGNNVMGAIVGSDRPYSCTERGDSSAAGFVMFGNALRDPVTRLAGLMGALTVADLGVEIGEDGTPTRHVRMTAKETDESMRQVPTTWDLWVDADRRVVRARFTGLSGAGAPRTATFSYGEVPDVSLPADHGPLVFRAGSGVPGFGGYLLGQYGTTPPGE